jgi:hypothetical protein
MALGVNVTDRFDLAATQLANLRAVVADPANAKLKLYTALGTEAANASDQSAIVVRALAIGERAGVA